jgi:hypothetical protein
MRKSESKTASRAFGCSRLEAEKLKAESSKQMGRGYGEAGRLNAAYAPVGNWKRGRAKHR